jgi:hypothetical protein
MMRAGRPHSTAFRMVLSLTPSARPICTLLNPSRLNCLALAAIR